VAGGSWIWGQCGVHREILSQKKKKKNYSEIGSWSAQR
jgi:hypothetical protein